jgi:N-ethylmaleimide reductase
MQIMSKLLFSATTLGSLTLKNRIVMAPMTRCRASGNVPHDVMVEYYRQRAQAGLIVTEGTAPSPNGLGYARIPGLYSMEQVQGWRKVTDAVHAAGARIFVQLMHTGRASHRNNMPSQARVLAPSAIRMQGEIYTDLAGMQPFSEPEAMSEADIEQSIEEFVQSAKLAMEAGFDGVELHGANGYLIEQFINPASNQRNDAWGGTPSKRLEFPVQLAQRVIAAIGGARVGIRVSPYGVFNEMQIFPEIPEAYAELARRLSPLNPAYMHIIDPSARGVPEFQDFVQHSIRANFQGTLILASGYEAGRAEDDLQEDRADLIAFGRPFISNPDLVEKLKHGLPLCEPDPATFYTPGEKGYTDYPVGQAPG